jgi:5'-nucleotidase/UDP-sugar diphosphatase
MRDLLFPQRLCAGLALAAGALLLAGCATPVPPAKPARAPLHLTIIHTNDHHGHFWPNADGEYGMAARKTVIDRIRAEVAAAGGQTMLIDGGDINTGVPESSMQEAEPDFIGMNLLGYDASAVGNHEFDQPPEVLARQRQWAKFAFMSANIYKDGQRMFEPYRVFDRGGYKIAVLALTTDETAKLSMPAHMRGLEFRKPAEEAARLIPELRAQADMVIASTHMGHYADGARGVNFPGDVEMARSTKGLDLIVGGHSHSAVCMQAENVRNEAYLPGQPCAPDRQNGTWIVQANLWGKYVGRADFVIDAGQIQLVKYQLIPINLKRKLPDGSKVVYTEVIPEDPAVHAALLPFRERGAQRLTLPVGVTVGLFDGDNDRVRRQPTSLGTLLARAMLERTGADLALMNSGGIRDSLPEGAVAYRDLLKVQPFGNTIAVVRLTGAELLSWLRAAAKMTPGAGAYPQTTGVQMRIEGGVLVEARVQGQPIDPLRQYHLALNQFTAVGGDGYPPLDKHPGYSNTGFVDAEVLRAYIAQRSPIRAADYSSVGDVQRK